MHENDDTYQALDDALRAFRSRNISLSDLVDRAPSLVKQIAPAAEWKDEFVSYWWTLEQVHEEAIEAGESRRLPPERREAVDTAIDGMTRLVQQAMATAASS